MNRLLSALILTLPLLLLTTANAEDPAAKKATPPNVLFCIADDWGWPHAGAYASTEGDEVVKTPNFDKVAREGALFHNAYISAPSCTPSRNAILTGQYHWRLDEGANLYGSLRQDLESYPHLLRDAGYHIGHWRKSYGPGKLTGKWQQHHPAGRSSRGFGAFLESNKEDKPFCFWLGASDPHRGYKLHSGRDSGMDLDAIKLFPFFPDCEQIRGDVADYYFEVQRFDSDVGKALALLEQKGLADNTIVVITGDHGMPFPRCKSNLYDSGARVPLAIRWPARVKPGQVFQNFVSTADLAPTYLDAAELNIPETMTGKSLLRALTGGGDGALRPYILHGKERHVPSQEAPDNGGYPSRAIRNHDYLMIRNYQTARWPNGTPNWDKANIHGAWYADTDNGPTKSYIVDNKDKDEAHRQAYDWCFGKRPAVELFDLKNDPHQLVNIAEAAEHAAARKTLDALLSRDLAASGDPRETAGAEVEFDEYSYGGGAPKFPGMKKAKTPKKPNKK